jgi:branched-subunit amino acid ABC-type transport system permease component
MKRVSPIVIVLMAAAGVILLSHYVARTEWGAGVRASRSANHPTTAIQRANPERQFIAPLGKEVLMMGIPGTLVVVILRISKRRGRHSR